MKKLLLVGLVGLSALLGGCGGGDEGCEESPVLPPVEDVAKFPNDQAPEYVIRVGNEIEVDRIVTKDELLGQIISMELTENSTHPRVVLQEFTADYSNGYLTKPTMNIHEFSTANIQVKLGEAHNNISASDLIKLKDELLTVKKRGGLTDLTGHFTPNLVVSIPAMGVVEMIDDGFIYINGIKYPSGKVHEDVKEGMSVAGFYSGDKLNTYQTSFSGSAWGILLEVKVEEILNESTFAYTNSYGEMVLVNLPEPFELERSDRIQYATDLKLGQKVLIKAGKMGVEIDNAYIYAVE